jgi:hypothetical protein
MNRLTPLIARAPARSGPTRFAEIGMFSFAEAASSEDVRLFVTAFLGGLIFFGTLFF